MDVCCKHHKIDTDLAWIDAFAGKVGKRATYTVF